MKLEQDKLANKLEIAKLEAKAAGDAAKMTRHQLMLKEVAMNPKRHHARKAKKPEPTPQPKPEEPKPKEPKPEEPKPVKVELPPELPVEIPVAEEEPEWEPIIERVDPVKEPQWEPIIERVYPETENNIKLIRDERKPIIQPIMEEKVKIDAKAADNVDVIATVPDIDHLITKVTDNEIDHLVKSVPSQKLVKDMSKDEDVDKFITKVSENVQS